MEKACLAHLMMVTINSLLAMRIRRAPPHHSQLSTFGTMACRRCGRLRLMGLLGRNTPLPPCPLGHPEKRAPKFEMTVRTGEPVIEIARCRLHEDAAVERPIIGIWALVALGSSDARVQCAGISPLITAMAATSEFRSVRRPMEWCSVIIALTFACSCCGGVMTTMNGDAEARGDARLLSIEASV